MLRLMFGGLAVWLYRSERARGQVRQRLAGVPLSLQRGAEPLAAAAERGAGLVGATPLPGPVRDRTAAAVRSAAEWARRGAVDPAGESPSTEQPVAALGHNPIPDDILAEQDAAARAAAEARAELQAGL